MTDKSPKSKSKKMPAARTTAKAAVKNAGRKKADETTVIGAPPQVPADETGTPAPAVSGEALAMNEEALLPEADQPALPARSGKKASPEEAEVLPQSTGTSAEKPETPPAPDAPTDTGAVPAKPTDPEAEEAIQPISPPMGHIPEALELPIVATLPIEESDETWPDEPLPPVDPLLTGTLEEAPAPVMEAPVPDEPQPAPPEAAIRHPEPETPQPATYEDPHFRAMPSMYIVHITPELAPVAKVGGLADVVFGLSRELEIRGNHVEVILPKYDCLRYDQVWGLTQTFDDLWVPWYGGAIHCSVFFGFVHGRKCFFIEPHSGDNFFNRGCIYGFNDDVLRFAFFSRAAMEFLWKSGKHPDIIHCHDWQTGLVPVFLYEIYQHLGMTHPRVCYTIHNFKHQGVTGAQVLHATGLNRPDYYCDYTRMRDNQHQHAINLMKAGIVYSNFVTTVSPRHAFEAKDQGQGFGLEPTLHIHHVKYGGVVNGIDYDVWNPEIDRYIPHHYTVDTLDEKYKNKRALRDRLLIADNEKPIVAFVGRLDPQKGLELIRHSIFYTLQRGGQFVLLGSSPDGSISGYFWGLKNHLNDNPDCHLEIGFNEELSHLIYAGADLMIVPSRFEPCGLTQMIAMKYATVPVVREIGGLADTVFDKDFSHRPLHERNGYVFRDYDNLGLESALGRAISCYYQYPDHFRELMKNAMRYDYSWKYPGQDYLNIYDYVRNK